MEEIQKLAYFIFAHSFVMGVRSQLKTQSAKMSMVPVAPVQDPIVGELFEKSSQH